MTSLVLLFSAGYGPSGTNRYLEQNFNFRDTLMICKGRRGGKSSFPLNWLPVFSSTISSLFLTCCFWRLVVLAETCGFSCWSQLIFMLLSEVNEKMGIGLVQCNPKQALKDNWCSDIFVSKCLYFVSKSSLLCFVSKSVVMRLRCALKKSFCILIF